MPDEPHRYQRRSLRLQGYDYTRAGLYFVTICTHDRALLFDDPLLRVVAERQWQTLPDHGTRGARPGRVDVDTWIVMPDHVHAIVVINDMGNDGGDGGSNGRIPRGHQWPATSVGAQQQHTSIDGGGTSEAAAAPVRMPSSEEGGTSEAAPVRSLGINVLPGSLGAIVRSYKAAVARRMNRLRQMPGMPVWQRGYWERIIRNEHELDTTRAYIADNPVRWDAHHDNLDDLLADMQPKEQQ